MIPRLQLELQVVDWEATTGTSAVRKTLYCKTVFSVYEEDMRSHQWSSWEFLGSFLWG